jgi:tetratricopeptide (TPR) repeat protein
MRSPSKSKALASIAVALALAACSSPADREARALKRGSEFLAAGNYEKARIEFKNALQAVPNDAEARYQNGVVLEKMGQLREAAQFYLGATEVNPKHRDARMALARLFIAGHAPNDALEVIDVGLEQSPGDGSYLGFRAAAKMQLQDRQGALEDAEMGFKAKPKDEYVVAILASISKVLGNVNRAREVLESGVAALPDSVDLRLALASLEADAHENGRAEHWLRKVGPKGRGQPAAAEEQPLLDTPTTPAEAKEHVAATEEPSLHT